MSTTLFHPNVPDLVRERDDEEEIKAHVEAGWLTEDPKVTAAKEAQKGAQTRKQKAEETAPVNPATSDAPVVEIVNETPQ
jgi:hypothetical protein